MEITHEQIVKALQDLGAKDWSLSGDSMDSILWSDTDSKTKTEILAAIAKPLPVREPTLAEKLARLGITADEAKLLIG